MSNEDIRAAASVLAPAPREFRIRRGVITAVGATTLTVTIGNASIAGIPWDESYTPTNGDVVNVFFDGPSPWVQGKLSTSP